MYNTMKLLGAILIVTALTGHTARATTVIASSYGFTAADATNALQSAIKSGADTVLVDHTGSDWITAPNVFSDISNLTIIFEPGVVLRAKPAVYTSTDACLIKWNECRNIKLIGNGTVLKMNKAEYTNGEWRHAISLRGCSNFTIEGFTIADSGGDGVYIGKGKTLSSSNIIIRNCFIRNHKRQGISVVSAERVLIEHCDIAGTKGTPPMAGIDFEPNGNTEQLDNCIVRNCHIYDNAGTGIAVVLHTLDATSRPIGIVVENTWIHDNTGGPQVFIMNRDKGIIAGNISIKNCLVENSNDAGLFIMKNKEEFGVQVDNCILSNVANTASGSKAKFTSPIMFETKVNKNAAYKNYGGTAFSNTLVNYSADKPAMHAYRFAGDENLSGNNGTITVVNRYRKPLFDDKTMLNSDIRQNFLQSIPKATVTLVIKDTVVSESAGTTTTCTVTRSSADIFPLPVYYTISGSAANGVDYDYLPGMVIIPANTLSATIRITPVKDVASEPKERLVINLKGSAFYTIGSARKTAVTIK